MAVHTPYLRRILDNLSSNILKYAGRKEPIQVQAQEEENTLVLFFRNSLKEREDVTEGTCVGALQRTGYDGGKWAAPATRSKPARLSKSPLCSPV